MIKAVVFDCFGVLATDGWLPFKEKHFSALPALYTRATDLNKLSDAGQLKYETYISQVAKLAGMDRAVAKDEIEDNIPNTALFDYIQQEIKPYYKLGLLSNAADNWLTEIFSIEQVALFDAIALSYQTKVIKPQPEAYKIIAARLQVELGSCIFIDDQKLYCDGAKKVGMQVVHYRGFDKMKLALDQLLR